MGTQGISPEEIVCSAETAEDINVYHMRKNTFQLLRETTAGSHLMRKKNNSTMLSSVAKSLNLL